MNVKNQSMILELVNKGILCSESVKAEMNGSYVASLDRLSTKNGSRLQVEESQLYLGCFFNYFLTRTHFNELSLPARGKNTFYYYILIPLKSTPYSIHPDSQVLPF